MKKADKSAKTVRNFDQLISKFSEKEIYKHKSNELV